MNLTEPATQPVALVDCYGHTDIGKVRENNEDQFLIADLNKSMLLQRTSLPIDDQTRLFGGTQGKLFVVADGMGGQAAGQRASSVTIEVITQYILNTMPWFFRLDPRHEDDIQTELGAALQKCRSMLEREVQEHPERKGMGTTVTMAYLVWPRLYVVHVGDSRCYLFRQSRLYQLTKDHTVAQQMIDAGVIDPQEAKDSPFSNALWNAVVAGADSETQPEVHKTRLAHGDSILLCTDGLTKHVSQDQIAAALGSPDSAEQVTRRLIDSALSAGGTDNVTVVTARFVPVPANVDTSQPGGPLLSSG